MMMSRKRGGEVLLAQQDAYLPDTSSSSRDQAAHGKRCCGTASHVAVGALSEPEVATFISRLLGSQLQLPAGLSLQALTGGSLEAFTGLSISGWQAFAELNELLGRNWHLINGSQLRGYHSFTTQDRQSLWQHYAAANGLSSTAAALVSSQSALPCHLRLVKFLLEEVLTGFPQASLTQYTMTIPLWAVGWAARWSWSHGEMSLLILQAHAADPSSSRGARQQTFRLFVPILV